MECTRVLCHLRLTGSGLIRHISRPRRAGFEGVLPGRRTDSGAARMCPEQCTCTGTGRQSDARGFHDIMLVNMNGETGPTVSMGQMSNLRRQWPTSLLTGITPRQTDLQSRLRNSLAGSCTYCGRNIIHDMARHVSNCQQMQTSLHWRQKLRTIINPFFI